jgi:hypothetical protein
MKLAGTWHIYEMDEWEEEYFNMEGQAFITISDDGTGDFRFGLLTGQLDGVLSQSGEEERLDFTWEGSDESDLAAGSGWFSLKDSNILQGKIDLDYGDSSGLLAKRA